MADGTGGASTPSGIRFRSLAVVIAAVAVLLSLVSLFSIGRAVAAYEEFAEATESYIACENAANQLQAGSDYLTTQVRLFVTRRDVSHLNNFFIEARETRRRDIAVETLGELVGESDAHTYLDRALEYSSELLEIERYAMRLVVEAEGIPLRGYVEELSDIELTPEDAALSAAEKLERANELVLGEEYQRYDELIDQCVALCKDSLMSRLGLERSRTSNTLGSSLRLARDLVVGLVLAVVAMVLGLVSLVLVPLHAYVQGIERGSRLEASGARELRILADAYNEMFDENLRSNEQLRRKSQVDALTGIYNREVFEGLLGETATDEVALLLLDIDHFKEINDTYGHLVGDEALKKVAAQLAHAFRSSDYPCRIGGDEFAVIMMQATPEISPVITAKIEAIRTALLDTSDGVPPLMLSIGIAFGPGPDDETRDMGLYKRADEALYRVKEAGRNGYQFW